MLVFENEVASVFHETAGYLRLVMRPGPYSVNQLRAVFLQVWPHQQAGTYRTLLDLRLSTPISAVEQKWVLATIALYPILPLLRDRVAHLVAHDVFARLSIIPLLVRVFRQADTYKTFDHEADAVEWLLN